MIDVYSLCNRDIEEYRFVSHYYFLRAFMAFSIDVNCSYLNYIIVKSKAFFWGILFRLGHEFNFKLSLSISCGFTNSNLMSYYAGIPNRIREIAFSSDSIFYFGLVKISARESLYFS